MPERKSRKLKRVEHKEKHSTKEKKINKTKQENIEEGDEAESCTISKVPFWLDLR